MRIAVRQNGSPAYIGVVEPEMNRRYLPAIVALLAALLLGGMLLWSSGADRSAPKATGTALIGGPFNLLASDGQRRTQDSWPGKHLLVYFGFTYCPDVCPIDLARMSVVLESLEASAPDVVDKLQPLFITIDPARDTPDQIALYLSAFSPRIVGLSGSQAEIDVATKSYRVYAARRAQGESDDSNDYAMDHSSLTYLINPEGKYVTHFSSLDSAQDMEARLLASLK